MTRTNGFCAAANKQTTVLPSTAGGGPQKNTKNIEPNRPIFEKPNKEGGPSPSTNNNQSDGEDGEEEYDDEDEYDDEEDDD